MCDLSQPEMTPAQRLLWAPWRIDYIRGIKDNECFLCEKSAVSPEHEEEELIIARGRHAFLVMNAYPYNSGHVLAAPYRHLPDLTDLNADETNEIMVLLLHMKGIQARLMHPEGFNIGFNLGAAAGAGLKSHVHGHLVPRWTGDTNFMPVIGNTRVVPEALVDTARMFRQAWQVQPPKYLKAEG